MKSGPGHRLLVFNAIALLVLASCWTLGRSDDTEPTEPIELNNFLKTEAGKWPSAPSDKTPFYVFYRRYSNNANALSFNGNLLNNKELASRWTLQYKYAVDNPLTLRSSIRKPSGSLNEVQLGRTVSGNQMTWNNDGYFVGEGASEWKHSQFLSIDDFLLGLKDVKVQYVAKETAETVETDPVHGYKTGTNMEKNIEKISKSDNDITEKKPDDSVYYGSEKGVKIVYDTNKADSVVLQLKEVPSTTKSEVTFKYDETAKKCIVTGLLAEIKDIIATCESDASKKVTKISINAKTGSKVWFAVWGVKPGGKVEYDGDKTIKTREIFTVKKVSKEDEISFVNIIDSQPAIGDACYTLELAQEQTVDVYLTYEGINSGLKLKTATIKAGTSDSFCLNDFVALRNMKNYQITYAIKGKINNPFPAILTTINKADSKLNLVDFTTVGTGWYYYNTLLDFSLETADAVDPKPAGESVKPVHSIEACDPAGNCVPLVEGQKTPLQADKGKAPLTYNLHESSKPIFTNSPYIRFQSSEGFDKLKLKFSESDKLAATTGLFQKQFNTLNAGKVKVDATNTLKYSVFLNASTQFISEVQVPLENIDTRLYQLKMNLKMVNKQAGDTVTQVNVARFTYTDHQNAESWVFPDGNILLPDVGKISLNEGDLKLSTADLAVTKPTAIPPKGRSVIFELEYVDNDKLKEPQKPTLEITFEVVKVDQAQTVLTLDTKKDLSKEDKTIPNPIHFIGKASGAKYRIGAKKIGGLLTKWIQVNDESTIVDTGLITKITVTNSDPAKPLTSTPIIYRVLYGQGVQLTSQLKGAFKDPKTKLSFELVDNSTDSTFDAATFKPAGPFRVAYLIQSQDETPIDFALGELSVKSPVLPETATTLATGLAGGNAKYDLTTCSPGFESAEGTNDCQQKTLYRSVEKTCDAKLGCSNIFSTSLLLTSHYADAGTVFIPYQLNNKTEAYIKVNRMGITKDNFCVTFKYKALNSSIRVSTTETMDQYTRVYHQSKEGTPTVCASHLTNDPKSIKSIYIRFSKRTVTDVDVNYLFAIGNAVQDDTTVASFTEGIYRNNNDKNNSKAFLNSDQFIDDDPLGKFLVVMTTNELNYELDKVDIIQLKKEFGDDYTHYSTIRTKWIKTPKTTPAKVYITLLADKASTDFKDRAGLYSVFASIMTPSTSEVLAYQEIKDFSTGLHTFDTKLTDNDYFQVVLTVSVDLSKITKDLLDDAKFKSISLTFADFTVNDPCIDEAGKLKLCTDPKNGQCSRKYDDFKDICECNKGYTSGKEGKCEKVDYCVLVEPPAGKPKLPNWQTYCKSKDKSKCTNDDTLQTFICACTEKEIFDIVTKQCIKPADLDCKKENEIYNPEIKNGKAIGCECISDSMVRINGTCTVFDPCNADHRKLPPYRTGRACTDVTAQCTATGPGKDDFTCTCKGVNKNGNTNAQAVCLPEECKACEQECSGVDPQTKKVKCSCTSDYDLQPDGTCKPKKENKDCISEKQPKPFLKFGVCQCIKGFKWNATTKICEGTTELGIIFGCPGVVVEWKEDGSPGCKCALNQQFNTATRKCDPVCDSNYKQNTCAKYKADCTFDTKTSVASCTCPSGQVRFAADPNKPEDWQCVSLCDYFLELPDQYDKRCKGAFEHCDKTVDVQFDEAKMKTDKTTKLKVAIANSTFTTPPNLCECNLGFVRDSAKECEPIDTPIHTIHDLHFNLDPTKTTKDTKSIEEACKTLITTVLGAKKEDVLETHCTISGTTADCTISFKTTLSDDVITKKMEKACVPVGDTGKCIYLIKDVPAPAVFSDDSQVVSYSLESAAKPTIIVDTKDYCKDPTICAKYPYTTCTEKQMGQGKATLFECLCIKKDFIQLDHSESITSNKLKMETCSVKNLCSNPKYGCRTNATCHFQVEPVGADYQAETFCTCPSTGLTLVDRKLSCAQTCNGHCGSSKTCAFDDRNGNGTSIVCHCDDGWGGADCKKKVESKQEEASKAYLISTIVVSVIAVIALIALGVLYFRRQ